MPTSRSRTPATFELAVVHFEGRIHCAYLNDYRIAGDKPWGGGVTAKNWKVELKDLAHAVPAIKTAFQQRDALHAAAKALYAQALEAGQPENPELADLLASVRKSPRF